MQFKFCFQLVQFQVQNGLAILSFWLFFFGAVVVCNARDLLFLNDEKKPKTRKVYYMTKSNPFLFLKKAKSFQS